jgi:hypothetical protein
MVQRVHSPADGVVHVVIPDLRWWLPDCHICDLDDDH